MRLMYMFVMVYSLTFSEVLFALNPENAKQVMLKHFQRMDSLCATKAPKISILDIKTTAFYTNRNSKHSSSSSMKLYYTSNFRRIESEYFQLYQDEKELYTVLLTENLIVKEKSTPFNCDTDSQLGGNMFKDSLLQRARVRRYEPVSDKNLVLIEYGFPPKCTWAPNVDRMIFYFHQSDSTLSSIETFFRKGATVNRKVLDIKNLSLHIDQAYSASASSYLFQEGKLKPLYRVFQVRNKN